MISVISAVCIRVTCRLPCQFYYELTAEGCNSDTFLIDTEDLPSSHLMFLIFFKRMLLAKSDFVTDNPAFFSEYQNDVFMQRIR